MKDQSNDRRRRTASLAAVAASAVAAFVALGGVGVAQSAIGSAQQQYGKKVTLCHKGKKTISVGRAAVPAHLRHGDTVGTCAQARAKAAKAKAAKAAKAKAAKAKAAKQAKAKGAKAQKPAKTDTSGPGDAGKGKGQGKGNGKGK